ncbi:MAG: NAD(P)H-dependent oxidoreductase subunit E [Dehalococcoidia bacterium]|nr:NAD(P)H-dependent oxidoreductase subunit E [Dehalococcoidia bacterium]
MRFLRMAEVALGGRRVLAELTRLTGARVFETSADGQWTIERLPCFGTCARAPMMQINDQAYCNLTVESVRDIVLEGRPGEPAPIAGDGKPGAPAEEPTP